MANELYNKPYKIMQYISICPMCGKTVTQVFLQHIIALEMQNMSHITRSQIESD